MTNIDISKFDFSFENLEISFEKNEALVKNIVNQILSIGEFEAMHSRVGDEFFIWIYYREENLCLNKSIVLELLLKVLEKIGISFDGIKIACEYLQFSEIKNISTLFKIYEILLDFSEVKQKRVFAKISRTIQYFRNSVPEFSEKFNIALERELSIKNRDEFRRAYFGIGVLTQFNFTLINGVAPLVEPLRTLKQGIAPLDEALGKVGFTILSDTQAIITQIQGASPQENFWANEYQQKFPQWADVLTLIVIDYLKYSDFKKIFILGYKNNPWLGKIKDLISGQTKEHLTKESGEKMYNKRALRLGFKKNKDGNFEMNL